MNENKRGHHFIPNNSYLKNFADASGKVWVLNPNGKIYATNPSNIFKEAHFYTITLGKKEGGSLIVENTLAEIEGDFASIYREKISKSLALTDNERGTVAVFIAALYQRTKANREGLRGMFENLRDQLEKWTTMFRSNKKARDFSAAIPRKESDKKSLALNDVNNVLGKLDEYHSVTTIESLPRIAQIIFNMKWSIMIAPPQKTFIASDNPFCVLRPESIKKYGPQAIGSAPGLVYKDAEITVPLSSSCALLGGWILNNDGYLDVDEQMLEQINRRTMMYANDLVANNSVVLEKILEKNPK